MIETVWKKAHTTKRTFYYVTNVIFVYQQILQCGCEHQTFTSVFFNCSLVKHFRLVSSRFHPLYRLEVLSKLLTMKYLHKEIR